MKKLIYFSDLILPLANKISFLFIVFLRIISLLFKWNKKIELVHLDYSSKYKFDNSYVIIRYKFKNVLWYNFRKIKITTDDSVIVLNRINIPEESIKLIVYGLFNSKTYQISLKSEKQLQAKKFKTSLYKLSKLDYSSKPLITNSVSPSISLPQLEFFKKHIYISKLSYKQTDFL